MWSRCLAKYAATVSQRLADRGGNVFHLQRLREVSQDAIGIPMPQAVPGPVKPLPGLARPAIQPGGGRLPECAAPREKSPECLAPRSENFPQRSAIIPGPRH